MQRGVSRVSMRGMLLLSNKQGSMLRTMTTTASLFHRRHSSNSSNNTTTTQENDGPLPLFLVLNAAQNKDGGKSTSRRPKLLLPPEATATTKKCITAVSTIQDILDAVNQHYCAEKDEKQQFVGGMGESDPGVWFITNSTEQRAAAHYEHDDPLDHAELVAESIQAVKEQRHGVPFGLFTTGILKADNEDDDDIVMSCLKRLNTLQVSLYAASPPDYSKATGLAMPEAQVAFGRACSFLAMVGENKSSKLTLEVGLSKSLNSTSAKAGRDLALSLGAQQVHFY